MSISPAGASSLLLGDLLTPGKRARPPQAKKIHAFGDRVLTATGATPGFTAPHGHLMFCVSLQFCGLQKAGLSSVFKLKISFTSTANLFFLADPDKSILYILNNSVLNCSYMDLRVFRWAAGAVISSQAGAEYGSKVHVATEEQTHPLKSNWSPKVWAFQTNVPFPPCALFGVGGKG